jgi:hypothetical protein
MAEVWKKQMSQKPAFSMSEPLDCLFRLKKILCHLFVLLSLMFKKDVSE